MTDTNTDNRRREVREVRLTKAGEPGPNVVESQRQAEVVQKRRRREGLGDERNLRMHVAGHDSDPNWVYRWANLRQGRVHQLTVEDDWEIAPQRADAAGYETSLGTSNERSVDKFTGEKAILLRKPKQFHEDDLRAKEAERKKGDATLRRGPLPSPNGAADQTYVPDGKNIIGGM